MKSQRSVEAAYSNKPLFFFEMQCEWACCVHYTYIAHFDSCGGSRARLREKQRTIHRGYASYLEKKSPLQFHVLFLWARNDSVQPLQVALLKHAPPQIPCCEAFGVNGADVLLYKEDDLLDFQKVSYKLKLHTAPADVMAAVHAYFKKTRSCKSLYLVRKIKGNDVWFAEVPQHLVTSFETYCHSSFWMTDDGCYDVVVANDGLKECRVPLIFQLVDSLKGVKDVQGAILWQALSTWKTM